MCKDVYTCETPKCASIPFKSSSLVGIVSHFGRYSMEEEWQGIELGIGLRSKSGEVLKWEEESKEEIGSFGGTHWSAREREIQGDRWPTGRGFNPV